MEVQARGLKLPVQWASPENTAPSSLNVGFVGVGGGGNKMVNATIELGFNKTLMVNSTGKDIPKNVE